MRQPEFWHRPGGIVPTLLTPCGFLYGAIALMRERAATPWRAPVPVICVGNLTVGGTGKTPTALAIASVLQAWGMRVAFLSRGYGGTLRGPVAVDPLRHGASEVGDEPLLLAARAPTWVARDRKDGARLAIAGGADVIIMDDGLQNPMLAKDLRLVVVDAEYGFGNRHVMPAGPLREPLDRGLGRADAFVLIGEDKHDLAFSLSQHAPVLRAMFVPNAAAHALAGHKVHAFAGIGRPEKFFAMLDTLGAVRVATHAFADHHPYTADEIARLLDAAKRDGAVAVTTAKDLVRLPASARAVTTAVEGKLVFEDNAALQGLLRRAMHNDDTGPERTNG